MGVRLMKVCYPRPNPPLTWGGDIKLKYIHKIKAWFA